MAKIHVIATCITPLTIGSFFVSSLVAEMSGDETLIKDVKEAILFAWPLLLVALAAVGLTGNKLAGQSPNQILIVKRKRMRFVFINGMALLSLACFLY